MSPAPGGTTLAHRRPVERCISHWMRGSSHAAIQAAQKTWRPRSILAAPVECLLGTPGGARYPWNAKLRE
eukprot:12923912-Prorocentrum_lima.AAC.1